MHVLLLLPSRSSNKVNAAVLLLLKFIYIPQDSTSFYTVHDPLQHTILPYNFAGQQATPQLRATIPFEVVWHRLVTVPQNHINSTLKC